MKKQTTFKGQESIYCMVCYLLIVSDSFKRYQLPDVHKMCRSILRTIPLSDKLMCLSTVLRKQLLIAFGDLKVSDSNPVEDRTYQDIISRLKKFSVRASGCS